MNKLARQEIPELIEMYYQARTLCDTPPHSEEKVYIFLDIAEELEKRGMKFMKDKWHRVK